MKIPVILLFLSISFNALSSTLAQENQQKLSPSDKQNNKKYSISLKDWPADMALRLIKLAPEISENHHDLESLNSILKKLDNHFNFNSLRFVAVKNYPMNNELLLVGEISAQVKKINFNNLSNIDETEALNLMGLNVNNILDEEVLKLGTEKLAQFYRDLGYRSAQVKFEIISDSTIDKIVNFNINKKEKTRLISIKTEGLTDLSIEKKLQKSLQKNFRLATLNQETLNKISSELRKQLSYYGYYTILTPSPQILFTADELNARLIFKLKSSPRYKIEILNTKRFEHLSLKEDVLKLKTYFTQDPNIAAELTEKLKAYYISEGYPHVNITSYEENKSDHINIYITVEEGPYTSISEIKIIGQFSHDENFYQKKFYELASDKVQNKMYVREDIETAVKNLLIYLQNEGFVNAKFTRVAISTENENPKKGLIIIHVDEGPQVKIASLQYEGVSPQNLAQVKQATKLETNQNLSLSLLELSLLNIKKFYQEAGYIEYKLLNENTDLVTYNDNNTQLDLKFAISEGAKVEVQSIIIDGNTRTNDRLILTELDFKVGDILNPEKIEESISRLQRTGHFNSVEITTLEKDTSIAQRTIVVKVIERDPGVTVLGVGFTDENKGTLHGYTGVAYRNFMGWGIGASFRSELNYNFADIKYLEQKHTFGFVYPYLFETRARFRTSATRSDTIADVRINKISEANSAVFSLEQDFTSHITVLFSYTVSTYKDHGITREDEIKFGYASESLVIGSVGPTLDFDYRDNLFNPTKGSFTRFSFEFAAEPLGNNNVDDFYRLTGQTTHYFPLQNTDFIFVQSLRGGYVKDIDARGEGVPFDKKGFYLGGRTTIRGFSSSEFFPTTGLSGEIPSSYRLNTSSTYELIKTELRFPLSIKYDLSGAFFYDGGQVQIEGVSLVNNWRDAAGFGLRYNTPVGPLNLEYAHKINKKVGENDGAFHLSVGVF